MEYNSGLPGIEKTRYATLNKNANPGLIKTIPAVENQTRFAKLSDIYSRTSSKKITESNFWAADSSFFKLFDFPPLEGNRKNALSQTNSILLTKKQPANTLAIKKR